MIFLKKIEILGGTQLRFFCYNLFACKIINKIINEKIKKTQNKIFNVGNFNTNIVQLSKKILSLTKIKNVNVFHETNTIDKRSYEVSTKSSKKLINNLNFNKYTNYSIIETFKKIKKDKSPFSEKKITLSVYKQYLKSNKI